MKFQDLPAHILSIRIQRADGSTEKLPEQPVFSVQVNQEHPDQFNIRLQDLLFSAKPVASSDGRRLNAELAWGQSLVAQITNTAADGSMELQLAFFTGECVEMGNVDIGVDEHVVSQLAKLERRKYKGNEVYKWLDSHCCFRQGSDTYFFMLAGPAMDIALKTDGTPEESLGKANPTRQNSFCVVGDGLRFIATKTTRSNDQSIFTVTRLTGYDNTPDRALRLAKGQLEFSDWTRTGQIQTMSRMQMAQLTQDEASYLKKWDEFGDLEGEILLQQAREIGGLQYSDLRTHRAGDDGKASVSVCIAQASASALDALAQGRVQEVEVVAELPDYLNDKNLSFKQFAKGIEQDAQTEASPKSRGRPEEKTYFKVSDFDPETRTITLATENLPENSGLFILSLAGEITQIKRRMSARSAILEGRAANPQLGPLIEEKGRINAVRRSPKITPLTAFVREKIFFKPPTVMQEKAIEVALNTPDIALIQGPPGTGKTTVIAAILERLNELADKRGAGIKGQVLLTGFQHDAVENMIQRMSLNSIPVPKFGKRSGSEEDNISTFERNLESWCSKIAVDLRAQNPQIEKIEQETEIRHLCLQYVQLPTRALAVELAGKIASLGVPILGEAGARRARGLAKRLSHEENSDGRSAQWLEAVRRLRIRTESFADDGPERAADALDDLEDVLEDHGHALLNKASLWCPEDGAPPFLNDLADLKKKLLVRFTTPPVFRVEKQNDEVIALVQEAVQCIQTAGYSTRDQKSAALAEFLAELENNPEGMMDAVSAYSFAFAATCQQSVNRRMQKEKQVKGDDTTKLEYEYVIVDEAARVSPRDLMVAMVQGKRIILVGDHRQLPHIIDEEVSKQMEAGMANENQATWLKKSMFEYLFSERLKTLEESDGITRRVTLDRQYRMHPMLGDFISHNFYERFDPLEKFGSGRPESDFAHNLLGTDNVPAVWLDVPASKGGHRRHGTSWTRPAEAIAIAHQLQAWRTSDNGKELSYGVISFYKAQAELIRKQLGAAANGDDKSLRIGTVDSFQGMEFDVVFLSMVRTVPEDWKPRNSEHDKQAQSLFGHLCLYNRLNVSMSRQKKLLVVAGDSGLLRHKLAAESIPSLVNFMALCQTEGRILQCS